MQIGGKNVRILVNGSVLNHRLLSAADILNVTPPRCQEIHLQIETPTLHILIEIRDVWIVIHILQLHLPTVVFRQQIREGSFPCADVSCNRNVLSHTAILRTTTKGLQIINEQKFYTILGAPPPPKTIPSQNMKNRVKSQIQISKP